MENYFRVAMRFTGPRHWLLVRFFLPIFFVATFGRHRAWSRSFNTSKYDSKRCAEPRLHGGDLIFFGNPYIYINSGVKTTFDYRQSLEIALVDFSQFGNPSLLSIVRYFYRALYKVHTAHEHFTCIFRRLDSSALPSALTSTLGALI